MNIECVYAPTRILLIVSVQEVMCIRINTVHISIPDCIVISCHLALSIVPLYFPVHSYDMTIIMSDNAFHISHRPGDRASLPIPTQPYPSPSVPILPTPSPSHQTPLESQAPYAFYTRWCCYWLIPRVKLLP